MVFEYVTSFNVARQRRLNPLSSFNTSADLGAMTGDRMGTVRNCWSGRGLWQSVPGYPGNGLALRHYVIM
jgi:hypothetical protein